MPAFELGRDAKHDKDKLGEIERSTLFRRPGCEKVAPAGQFEAVGGVVVPCRHPID
jgi:hypothetical protein